MLTLNVVGELEIELVLAANLKIKLQNAQPKLAN